MTSHVGGCSCGSVRYAIDDYLYVLASLAKLAKNGQEARLAFLL